MRRIAFIVPAMVIAALLAPLFAACETEPVQIPDPWFNGPERHHDHWKVAIGPPFLTFSQRVVVPASALLPISKKLEQRPDLHFVLRVADEAGNWFPGYDHDRIDVAALREKEGTVSWHSAVYVRPGKYQFVVLIYDALGKQHYVWRKFVTVEKQRVLPDLDQSLPMIEFTDFRRGHAPLGEHLPIENKRPLRIDIVLNLTGEVQMSMYPGMWRQYRHLTVQSALMGSLSALTQLRPTVGCVRISAVDIVHLEVARDRALVDPGLDWEKVRQTLIKNRDANTVDIRTLEGRTKARAFFRDFLGRVMADNTGCGSELPRTDRAVIVVSDSVEFPSGSSNEPVPPPPPGTAQFFHVQIRLRGIGVYDQVGHMLHDLHPRHFGIDDPEDLRKALAEIINDLEKQTSGVTTLQ